MTEIKKLSAGIVVVRKNNSGSWLYLILRFYRNWDFPKGLVEECEDSFETARRETSEETSINDLQFSWGHSFTETQPYAGGKVARYYLATTDKVEVVFGINPEIGGPEHNEYKWATPSDQNFKASIDTFNDTGYSNDDLFKIIQTAQLPDSAWITYIHDEMIALINKRCSLE